MSNDQVDEVWIPPTPRHASTVCLVRDGATGVEVFVMRRKSSMKFAPRMYVFPGGAVEAADNDVPLTGSVDLVHASQQLFSESPAAVIAAGARETFEECGVLMATSANGSPPVLDESLMRDRAALVAHEMSFTDL